MAIDKITRNAPTTASVSRTAESSSERTPARLPPRPDALSPLRGGKALVSQMLAPRGAVPTAPAGPAHPLNEAGRLAASVGTALDAFAAELRGLLQQATQVSGRARTHLDLALRSFEDLRRHPLEQATPEHAAQLAASLVGGALTAVDRLTQRATSYRARPQANAMVDALRPFIERVQAFQRTYPF